MTSADVEFLKGHGTENDFVVLPDEAVALELDPARVTALCDRQRGLGADGVLRVAKAGELRRAGVLETLPDGVEDDDWFMDYRNADGSIAEMCGNGVRVFAHYLVSSGRAALGELRVGTRAGARPVVVHAADAEHGDVTVEMGSVRELGTSTATVDGVVYEGIGIDVGNPHLAVVSEGLEDGALAEVDLHAQPTFDHRVFPQGVNVELVTPLQDGRVSMRVHERGVGETRSCGTGTVAAAAAALRHEGRTDGEVEVDVPGGRIDVSIADGQATLRGPSVIVAHGSLGAQWWRDLA